LDFNQPMIEDDNTCKERFLEMLNKVDKLGDSLGQKINTDYPLHSKIYNPSDYKELPDEVYCEALDFYDQYKDNSQGRTKPLNVEFTYPEDDVQFLKVYVAGKAPVFEYKRQNTVWKMVVHTFVIIDNHDRVIGGFDFYLDAPNLSSEDIEAFRNMVESI